LGFGDGSDPAHNMSLLTVIEGNIRACACVKECAEELKKRGQVRFGGGGSSLHSGIEFRRSRTWQGSSGGRKKGVV
jgi:hypothetical protein